MSSLTSTMRGFASAARHNVQHSTARRAFRTFAPERAAQNYTMPALSPTMTEGNIANWQVKEGDSYSTGDVLLEIETDKATMDVEAQDDGILMKIISPNGAKGVKVGERIAVIAEPGDDISKLDIPADESKAAAPRKAETKDEAPKHKEQSQAEAKSENKVTESSQSAEAAQSEKSSSDSRQPAKYPLMPSVEHLLHRNGLSEADVQKIPTSGPGGRLLKGDVLAYLGQINKDYPAQASARLQKLGHLDLSNIQLAPKRTPEATKDTKKAEAEVQEESATEIALPISLATVIATQKKISETLGIHLPLSTFIARASELANDDLPVGKKQKPTADALFNAVLGLDKVPATSRGHYFPHITGLATPATHSAALPSSKKTDIFDILTAAAPKKKAVKTTFPTGIGISAGENVFSVIVKNGEERRATEYLERMKLVLEQDPGRLVL